MSRNWIGIRVSAVLAVLGSAVTLLLALFVVFATFFTPPPREVAASPIPLKPLMCAVAGVLVALSAWGILTAIAIFGRRGWARISILVFAAFLALLSAGGMLAVLSVQLPTPPGSNAALTSIVRWFIAAFYGGLTAIGVWWLVLFNRPRSKQYFDSDQTVSARARPLSVGIIGWWLLISAVFVVPGAIWRFPVMLLGIVVTGWATVAWYGAFGALQLYLGRGLLQLRETARLGSIAYFCFGAVNCTVSVLGPGYANMLRQMQASMPKFFPAGAAAPAPVPAWVMLPSGLAFAAIPIYFMLRRRPAFH